MNKQFECNALVTVAALVTVLVVAAVLRPLDTRTALPNAMLRMLASNPTPVPISSVFSSPLIDIPLFKSEVWNGELIYLFSDSDELPRVRVAKEMLGIDTLTGVFSVSAIEREHRLSLWKTSGGLSKSFKQLGYDLDSVRSGESTVPRLFLASLPADIIHIRKATVRKALFIKTMLPLVLQANEEILRDRRRLWFIHYQINLGKKLEPEDRLWLEGISERYGFNKVSLPVLLKRVDIIPPSLALAQAAKESGWGTSRFVREGNALFGQWTFSDIESLLPSRRDQGKQHRVRTFSSLLDSVRAYAHNLNTHKAYEKLRRIRNELRQKGAPVDGLFLVESIKKYSATGESYVRDIRILIEGNNLHHLDNAQLYEAMPKLHPHI